MNKHFSRRDFLWLTAKGFGSAVVSIGLINCANEQNRLSNGEFLHGVASGDPQTDSVIIWTRVTPTTLLPVHLAWEVSENQSFTALVSSGSTLTDVNRDFTLKIDVQKLQPGKTYYYRFFTENNVSSIGITQTLPEAPIDKVKFAVLSCANYSAGYFNVYASVSKQANLNAVLHLGDYIYEYGRGEYASEHAQQLNRQVLPVGELQSLSDYRTRYGQYRTDKQLQHLHAQLPFICIWDDHEVADNRWQNGANNHHDSEGDFFQRKLAAMQAYFEWLPIRPQVNDDEPLFRKFNYGDLAEVCMLDGRSYRSEQIVLDHFFDAKGKNDFKGLQRQLARQDRSMLGEEQLTWLKDNLQNSQSSWQVLGQQVLMGSMRLPAPLVTQEYSIAEFIDLAGLAKLAQQIQANASNLTANEIAFFQENQHRLTAEVLAMLQSPEIPYNLDAWDGYAFERNLILDYAQSHRKNLIVLSGDSHNAWANELKNSQGEIAAVEFATPSISSPGLETYLNIDTHRMPKVEQAIKQLIPDLHYTNMENRGYMLVEFTHKQVKVDWHFIDTVFDQHYIELSDRQKSITINSDSFQL